MYILEVIEVTVMILISVMYMTLLERKVLGRIQQREGPIIVGKMGILQPLVDGLKLFIKEKIIPLNIYRSIYNKVAIVYIIIGITTSLLLPQISNESVVVSSELSTIIIIVISSISCYSVLYSGYSSNNSYSILGSIRCVSQLISYEVYIGLIYIIIMYSVKTGNIEKISNYQVECPLFWTMPLIYCIYMISIISETNRSPFDISEGESELVSGWNVEYSGIYLVGFMVGEYSIIVVISYICSLLFLPLYKYIIFSYTLFIYIQVRGTYCRLRQDSLLDLGWKYILPIILYNIIFYIMLI